MLLSAHRLLSTLSNRLTHFPLYAIRSQGLTCSEIAEALRRTAPSAPETLLVLAAAANGQTASSALVGAAGVVNISSSDNSAGIPGASPNAAGDSSAAGAAAAAAKALPASASDDISRSLAGLVTSGASLTSAANDAGISRGVTPLVPASAQPTSHAAQGYQVATLPQGVSNVFSPGMVSVLTFHLLASCSYNVSRPSSLHLAILSLSLPLCSRCKWGPPSLSTLTT